MEDDDLFKVEEAAIKYLPKMTGEEFLKWEDKQEYKHEYIEGEIITMQGASPWHNVIVSNLIVEVGHHLKGKKCKILPSDMRVSAKSWTSYFYPDATIFCNDPAEADNNEFTFSNPSVVFEVLSKSTADFDLGRKQFYYMQMETLKQYITIDSRKPEVRIATRQADDSWKFELLNSKDDAFLITAVSFSCKLSELYAGVKF